MSTTPRAVVLVSGDGSNLQAIIDQVRRSALGLTLVGVVSDRPGVRALERGAAAGIPAHVVDCASDRPAFPGRLAATLADECEQRANLRVNAVTPGPMRSPLRTLTHPGEDKDPLPLPSALVPLYLHLVGGQAKRDSGHVYDGSAWLAGRPAAAALVAPAPGNDAARP